MKYDHVTTAAHLDEWVRLVREAPLAAFDTEFVSEDTYRPDLCLVQVAAAGRFAVIDPKEVDDVTPFWEALAERTGETLVHAGREEFRFCMAATGKRPAHLCDVQIAAGLIGLEYPAAYSTLAARLLGKSLPKGETRTDWRRRPLTSAQLEYALQDVLYLEPIRQKIFDRLEELGRTSWLDVEMLAWQEDIEAADSRERWRRVSGLSGLSPRALAVVRELWRWREKEAERRNSPPRRVLRDDLLVELARRQSADVQKIRAIRGMEFGHLQKHLPQIAAAIHTALETDAADIPKSQRRELPAQLNLLGQLLTTALGSLCHNVNLAPAMVGTAQDVRDLVAHRLGYWDEDQGLPLLRTGWRAEVIGHMLDELLDGKLSIHIRDPLADEPLAFEPRKHI